MILQHYITSTIVIIKLGQSKWNWFSGYYTNTTISSTSPTHTHKIDSHLPFYSYICGGHIATLLTPGEFIMNDDDKKKHPLTFFYLFICTLCTGWKKNWLVEDWKLTITQSCVEYSRLSTAQKERWIQK